MSRPFSPILAAEVLDRILEGDTLKKICNDIGLGYGTLRKWVKIHPEFGELYVEAMRDSARAMAEEELELCRLASENEYITSAQVQAKKMLSDSLRWHAKARDPATFGDKAQIEHVHRLKPFEQLSDAELERIARGDGRGRIIDSTAEAIEVKSVVPA